MFVAPKPDKSLIQIENILETTEVPFLISGNVENFISLLNNERLIYLKKPESLIEFLNNNNQA